MSSRESIAIRAVGEPYDRPAEAPAMPSEKWLKMERGYRTGFGQGARAVLYAIDAGATLEQIKTWLADVARWQTTNIVPGRWPPPWPIPPMPRSKAANPAPLTPEESW